MAEKENTNFIRFYTNAAAVLATETYTPNIESLKKDFGYNYNTLIVLNNSGEIYKIILNGDSNQAIPLAANGGSANIEAKDNFIFTSVELVNQSGAAQSEIGELMLTIGRTGKREL